MKLVRAVLRPERLGILCETLNANGFFGLTVIPVEGRKHKGFSNQELCRDLQLEDTLPRIQIEIVTTSARVALLTNIILESCRTGKAGDGSIVVIPVERVFRIQSGGLVTHVREVLDSSVDNRSCRYRIANNEHNSTNVPRPVAADQKGER